VDLAQSRLRALEAFGGLPRPPAGNA
jgi:hypothetical protein